MRGALALAAGAAGILLLGGARRTEAAAKPSASPALLPDLPSPTFGAVLRDTVHQLTPEGAQAIKRRERLRLKRYADGGGYSIGYGHHLTPDEGKVETITLMQAEAYFETDIAKFSRAVNDAVRVPLESYEFDALVSFAYNVGASAFADSTLVRRLNAGDWPGAVAEFGVWVLSQGKRVKALVERRADERRQFEGIS